MENIVTTENIDESIVPTDAEVPQKENTQAEQLPENNIAQPPSKKLWEGLTQRKAYSKSFDEFQKKYSTPQEINKLWTGLTERKAYNKSESDFQQQYFPSAPKSKYAKPEPVTKFGLGLAELGKPLFIPQPPQLAPIVPIKIEPEESKKEAKAKEEKYSGLGVYTIPGLFKEIQESGLNNIYGHLWNKAIGGVGKIATSASDIVTQMAMGHFGVDETTRNIVLKEYRDNVFPTISRTIKDNLGADVSLEKENKYNEGFVTGALGGLAETVPAMLTGPAMLPSLFLLGYQSQLESINSTDEGKKLPESTKTLFSTVTGVAGAFIEKAGIGKILGNKSSKVSRALSIKVLNKLVNKESKEITSEMVERALKAEIVSLKNQIIEKGGKIGSAAFVEGITGGLQEITNITGEKITNLSTGKQVFNYESFGNLAGRVIKSAGQEAIGGFVIGGVVSNPNKIDNHISDQVSKAKSIEDINKIKSDLALEVNNGSISDADAVKINGLIDEYSNIYSTIPEFSENRNKIASKIKERTGIIKDIESRVETLKRTDEAFQPQMMAEIEALKGRAVEINEEISNIARNKEAVVEEDAVTEIPESISSLKDDEQISFSVNSLDDVPEEFRDRAVKKQGVQVELREKILGLPIGKKTSMVVNDGYRYTITGKEAKDYAIKTQSETTATTETPKVKTVEQLRADEQKEYDTIDPNDEVKRKEIYDKYDKLITPLLQEGAVVSEKPIETKPIEAAESVITSKEGSNGVGGYNLNENEFSDIKTNVKNEETRKLINAVAYIYGGEKYTGDFSDNYISELQNMGNLGYEVSQLLNAPKRAAKLINEFAKKNVAEQSIKKSPKEQPIETKPIEEAEPIIMSTKEEQGVTYKPDQEMVIKEVETKLGGKKMAEDLFKAEARHTYGETYEDFLLRKGCQ